MENQLEVIIKESKLESTKAKYILDNFSNYFEVAAEWEKKAKSLVVTNEKQTAEMEMARTGRLFLKEKRLAIEKARKELKEQSLREGKAIDGIANVLKALIVPIEEYLEKQEKFIEIREEAKREAMRIEIEKKLEEERIAQEKAEAEERERIRIENEKLKQEALKREREIEAEREKVRAEARKKERELEIEREKQEAILAKERAKAKEKQRIIEEKAKAKFEAERKEKERLEAELKSMIECPKCKFKFNPENV